MGIPTTTAEQAESLQELCRRFRDFPGGKVADYIPELADADPSILAIAMVGIDGRVAHAGQWQTRFTIQSLSKPFVYGQALDQLGVEAVRAKVGVEPTGEAFNSIIELEDQAHRPYNPMINSGAIAISAMLHEASPATAPQSIVAMFEGYLGRAVQIDESVLACELETGHRNRAIGHLLRHFGVIGDDVDGALRLYSQQCSVLGDTQDLAVMAATLANGGVQPVTGQRVLEADHVQDVLSLMFTCGMYDASGEWAFSVGLPAKSGVSGGILAVVPGRMGLAVYSPALDDHGHSVRGMEVFKALSREWRLSMFGPGSRPDAQG